MNHFFLYAHVPPKFYPLYIKMTEYKLIIFNPFGKLHSFLAECILYEWIDRKDKNGIHIDDTWTEKQEETII